METRFHRVISPGLELTTDDSACIVLKSQTGAHTITNVDAFKAALDDARTFAQVQASAMVDVRIVRPDGTVKVFTGYPNRDKAAYFGVAYYLYANAYATKAQAAACAADFKRDGRAQHAGWTFELVEGGS